jgi:hypothetical protein
VAERDASLSTSTLFPRAASQRSRFDPHASTGAKRTVEWRPGSQASWARAFELFSEAVQQHHVSPTAQHFNLLLYIAQQHRLWSRIDAVEEFQAHLLASVQQLVAEKKAEERQRMGEEGRAKETTAQRSTPAVPSTGASLTASPAAVAPLSLQIEDLQEMEAALLPNAQTYDLLLTAALARGAWSRALEYCEMRIRSGVAALTDNAVRQILQVYALAGKTTGTEVPVPLPPTSATSSSPPEHVSLPQRLRTDQRGPSLRAAAQPRPPITTISTAASLSNSLTGAGSFHAAPAAPSPPLPYWRVALAFFRSSLHRVSSLQTVWSMASLLQRTGQPQDVLQLLNEDCRELIQVNLFSLASHELCDPHERTALLQTLKLMSDAAREVGDWQVAQQLLRDVVELRRQLAYTQSSSAGRMWRAQSLSAARNGNEECSMALRGVDSNIEIKDNNNNDDDLSMWSERRLSQYVLQNTLHTLRRVRRYADMVSLYRTSPHHMSGNAIEGGNGDSAVVDGVGEAAELTLVWRTMWTPQSLSFLSQAGLATRDLNLLLQLSELDDAGLSTRRELRTPPPPSAAQGQSDIPADVYDATLRLLQSCILQYHLRCADNEAPPLDKLGAPEEIHDKMGAVSDMQRYVVLSQHTYAAYRSRALHAVMDDASPYRQYLQRVTQKRTANDDGTCLSTSPLSTTYLPLVELLAQSLQSGVTNETLRSLSQKAVTHFKRIRRPDTLAIALVMDIVRSQTCSKSTHDLTDAEAELAAAAVQHIYDAVLEGEGLGSVQLSNARTSPSPHAQSHCPPESASLQQLTALSVVTSATVLMSFDILAAAQPLGLLRLIPLTVRLGWVPRELAAYHLQRAQQAVVAWIAAREKRDATPLLQPSATAARLQTTQTALTTVAKSSGAAVASFVRLYAQSTMTAAAAATSSSPAHHVLVAAAQVLAELQRSTRHHPPTAAMAAFKQTLHDAWKRRPPSNRRGGDELQAAVVASLNALLQQVGASSLSRWTVWGDCTELLGSYLSSPLAACALREEVESTGHTRRRVTSLAGDDGTASFSGSANTVPPNLETLQVLHTFLRLCDKAEAPFVEYVTMRWILNLEREASRVTAVDGHPIGTHGERVDGHVKTLLALCSAAPVPQRTEKDPPRPMATRPEHAPPTPLTDLHMETMLLLLDATAWACRRHERQLARQFYTILAPWTDALLSPVTAFSAASHDNASFAQQRERLRDAAQSTYVALLQCFSSGPRIDILRDWPLQLRVLRQLTLSESELLKDIVASTAPFAGLRRTAVLVDAIAAVVVKLQRTLHYLLTELSLDAHRARAWSADSPRNLGSSIEPHRSPASPHHRKTVEKAADEFAAWCTGELLPSLVLPSLQMCAEADVVRQNDPLTSPAAPPQPPSAAPSFSASLRRVAGAVWAVDYASLVWHTSFRPAHTEEEGDGGDEASTCAMARLRLRGYQLLTSQFRWPGAESELTRCFRLWLLFTAHFLTRAATPTSSAHAKAVAELCRDLTTLETLYTIRRITLSPPTEQQCHHPVPPPLLHYFIQQVDEVTTAVLTRTATANYGPVTSLPASAALPRMRDGTPVTDFLSKQLFHFTPPVLRLLQQAAQQVLYLSLCEGTTDVQSVSSSSSGVRYGSAIGDAPASSPLHPLPPVLLRRCLAWPGLPATYPLLLRAVEVAAYETLREPAAVIDVFHAMEQLNNAAALLNDHGNRSDGGDSADVSPSTAEMFLSFYLKSPALRRASPVRAPVCLAALLACAAAAKTVLAAVTPDDTSHHSCCRRACTPPQELLTLLSAFPHVLSDALVEQWRQRALTPHQEKVLRSWLLFLLWGGGATMLPAPVTPLQLNHQQSLVSFSVPLRRAALQWLIVTQGTVAPPPASATASLRDAEEEAATLNGAMVRSSENLMALLRMASDSFEELVNGSARPSDALATMSTRLLTSLSTLSCSGCDQENSKVMQETTAAGAVEAAVRSVVSCCVTRHAVQELLLHYPAVSRLAGDSVSEQPCETQRDRSAGPRPPHRPCHAEMEALVHLLAAPEQGEARARLQNGVSSHGYGASETPSFSAARDAEGLEEWAALFQQWIDAFAARLKGNDASLLLTTPPPPTTRTSAKGDAERTWTALHVNISTATRELLQRSCAASSSSPQSAQRKKRFETWVSRCQMQLRPVVTWLVRRGAAQTLSNQAPAQTDESTACVCALLMFSCVYVPLASPMCSSPAQAVALLRYEVLWLLCTLSPQCTTIEAFPPSSSPPASFTDYAWFVRCHLLPLFSLAAPARFPEDVKVATKAGSSLPSCISAAVAAAVETFAAGELILHHLGTTAWVLCTTDQPSHPNVLASVYETACELFRQSSEEMYNLPRTLRGLHANVASSLRGAAKLWMQAGVLIGEPHPLLSVGQRLTASLLRHQQGKTPALWVSGATIPTVHSGTVAKDEVNTMVEWLEVVPIAVVVCAAAHGTAGTNSEVEKTLPSLVSTLPHVQSSDDPFATSEGYASALRAWQQEMRRLALQATAAEGPVFSALTAFQRHQSYVAHLTQAQPFFVVFHHPLSNTVSGSNDDNSSSGNAGKLVERLRDRVANYLSRPPKLPPRSQPSCRAIHSTSRRSPCTTSHASTAQAAPAVAPLTPGDLRAAMRCVTAATVDDMRAFLQLESTKRGVRRNAQRNQQAVTTASDPEKAMERGEAVQRAWRLVERAAVGRRQHLGSREATCSTPPLVPFSEWTAAFLCRNVATVPHTIHFIRPAVSEVLMLECCQNWAEGLAVLQHSLSTLHRSGATPVQQYMAQLLLQRLRTSSCLPASAEADRGGVNPCSLFDFNSSLDGLTFTVPATSSSSASNAKEEAGRHLSRELFTRHLGIHVAHGAAALACCLVDLLLNSYEAHRILPASSPSSFLPPPTAPLVAQHTLMEALRCSVHDVLVTRAFFCLFWAQHYQKVEGAHAFLSALRAAKIAHDEAFAVQAVLMYLWVTTPGTAQQRLAQWEANSALSSLGGPEDGSMSVDLPASVKEVQSMTNDSYPLSEEAHRAVWKSWTALCRMGVVSEAVALHVVAMFKALNRLSEVEELMVTTRYIGPK